MAAALLTPTELAQRWRISTRTLEAHRARGDGPPFIKCGRSIRYDVADVLAHEALQKKASMKRRAKS